MSEPTGLPLEGIKIADFTVMAAGPLAGQWLGNLGATVVRVESAFRIDPMRQVGPFAGGKPGLTEPAGPMNFDSVRNRESARRLAALEPALVCFGHGPPLYDGPRFVQFVHRLAA